MSARQRHAKKARRARELERDRLVALLGSYDAVIADLESCGVPADDFIQLHIARSILDSTIADERRALAAWVLPP